MKYSLFYLIKGEADKYQQRLIHDIGPRFGEYHLIEKPLPTHITLKNPFEIEDSSDLKNLLEEFVKKQKAAPIEIKGFDNFNRLVVYSKVNFSSGAKKIQKNLVKSLENIGIELNNFDREHCPHTTISYANKRETFHKILSYLNKIEKPNFKLKFDNITLMRKSKKYWKIEKIYNIN